ncbi:hypothetical protein [Clostridioides difficile]|nr:hypothetical protein [Clostridioides difficile]
MFEFSVKVKRRRSCGATIAEEQFADDWRVMIDQLDTLLLMSDEINYGK